MVVDDALSINRAFYTLSIKIHVEIILKFFITLLSYKLSQIVLGQVINIIRECRAMGWGDTRTRHIRIPASYQAGITVAALTGSEAHRRLMLAPQLPILTQTDPA